MDDGLYVDLIVAREKQHDRCQAEQDRLVRLVRAGRETRVKAGARAWERIIHCLDRLSLRERTDRGSHVKDLDPYLLNALAWMMAKE